MSSRVVVTGASGLVGTWLRRTAPRGVELVPWCHETFVPAPRSVVADLRDRHAVVESMQKARPSLVVHAAMRSDAPSIIEATRHVAEAARLVGAHVLYVSTDAVFSGSGSPVDEGATPDPVWAHGRWKADAERIVLSEAGGSAVVRLPLVVSLDPADRAIRGIREGAARGEPTVWYDDETRQPAMAPDIAGAIWRIAMLEPLQRVGLWQLPGPEILSRYDIAQRVVATLDLDPACIVAGSTPSGSGRPRHIRMLCERAERQIGWSPAPILGRGAWT